MPDSMNDKVIDQSVASFRKNTKTLASDIKNVSKGMIQESRHNAYGDDEVVKKGLIRANMETKRFEINNTLGNLIFGDFFKVSSI